MNQIIWKQEFPVYINSINLERKIPDNLKSRIVGRYFSLSGFLNMLETAELCFKKISMFEDKAEGLPLYRDTKAALIASEKNVGVEYAQMRKENFINVDSYYASCWTMKDNESYLMWKNYSSFYEGVLVLSTVEQIIDSVCMSSKECISDSGKCETENCFFGEMDYNYNKEYISDHQRAFGKSNFFIDECEFRLVVYHHPQIPDNSIRRTINHFSFINNIICSPKATKEFINLVKKIIINYSLQESIVRESGIKQNSNEILDEFIHNA